MQRKNTQSMPITILPIVQISYSQCFDTVLCLFAQKNYSEFETVHFCELATPGVGCGGTCVQESQI